ncbi:anthranilate synthase component I [soil metagenome]
MSLNPAFEDFRDRAGSGMIVPVWRDILFDTESAVSAYHKIARPPFGFLLESVVGGERWARYTFVGSRPREAWRLTGDRIDHWTADSGWMIGEPVAAPLAVFDAEIRRHQPAEMPGLPRFWGGLVGYLGYDIVRHIERLPDPPPDELGVPDALFIRTDVVLAIDNLFGRARLIAGVETAGADETELHARYLQAAVRIQQTLDDLRNGAPPETLELSSTASADPPFASSTTRAQFVENVRRVQEYIRAGDAFQVVLSQRLSIPFAAKPLDLYRALRALNPSPYLFFLELDGFQLIGSSPEVLVRLEDGRVTVRPIAGTRRRGRTEEEDAALAEDLLADPKECAEHLMLLDLGRNDVGRVARFGTVRVPERMVIEKYSHVLHMVSSVEGEVGTANSAMDVLRAAFPAGTVSGAPKVRAMEIIDELEPVRRGPYAGAVGYFAHGGEAMDLAIAIRTIVVHQQMAYVQAGAGVVADSEPNAEYEETLNKARALLRALQSLSPG